MSKRSESTEESGLIDVNTGAVAGVVTIGGGFTVHERLLGAMDVCCMSSKTFEKHSQIVAKGWEDTALLEMKDAASAQMGLRLRAFLGTMVFGKRR